jgi:hypothetical protein
MSTETKKRTHLASFNDYQAGQDLGLVAQLVERCLCKAEALGPNPSKSIEINAHIEDNSMWKG